MSEQPEPDILFEIEDISKADVERLLVVGDLLAKVLTEEERWLLQRYSWLKPAQYLPFAALDAGTPDNGT